MDEVRGGSSSAGESCNSSTEMIEALQFLPPAMAQVVSILRGENEVLRSQLVEKDKADNERNKREKALRSFAV